MRAVGKVTRALHRLEAGDEIGVRGPFGHGFPIRILEGNDLLIVAGGLGIAPLRSLIHYVLDNRRDFGKTHILLGCRTPGDMLFADEIDDWRRRMDVHSECTVDRAAPEWTGHVGRITTLIPGVDIEPERTFAVVVGPPVMYKFVVRELLAKNIPERQILLSLERHMKCGVGKCGHCQINDKLLLPGRPGLQLRGRQRDAGGVLMRRPKVAFFDLSSCEGCQLAGRQLRRAAARDRRPRRHRRVPRGDVRDRDGEFDVAFVEGSVTDEDAAARLGRSARAPRSSSPSAPAPPSAASTA